MIGKCSRCSKENTRLTRGFCGTCYPFLRRNGLIDKYIIDRPPLELNNIQHELLIGSLLGDGCLYKHRDTYNPHLSLVRCLKDKEYALWQANILGKFLSKVTETSYFDKRTNKNYYHIKVISRAASVFNDYYYKWYINREKIIPDDLFFTPLILAIWFADDGHVRQAQAPYRMRLKLSTQGFRLEYVEKLSEILSVRYNESFPIHKTDGRYIIQTADNACRTFLREIDNYLPPGLDRKTYWRKPEARFYENIPKRAVDYKRTRNKINERIS